MFVHTAFWWCQFTFYFTFFNWNFYISCSEPEKKHFSTYQNYYHQRNAVLSLVKINNVLQIKKRGILCQFFFLWLCINCQQTFMEDDSLENGTDKLILDTCCFVRASKCENSGESMNQPLQCNSQLFSNSTENFQFGSIFHCLELKWAPNRHTKGQSGGKLDKIVNIRSLRNLSSFFFLISEYTF